MTAALAGLRVLDVSTLFAGPLAATMLGDFGADVVKVEHPRGDPVRTHGASKDGVGLWGKVVGRNKRGITLNLSDATVKVHVKTILRKIGVSNRTQAALWAAQHTEFGGKPGEIEAE